VTRLWAGRPEFDAWQGAEILPPGHRVRKGSGTHPTSNPVGSGALSPGIKPLDREDDHSPEISAEVRNAWSFISNPPLRLQSVVHN